MTREFSDIWNRRGFSKAYLRSNYVLAASIVFIASFVVMFLMMDRRINVYDEGIVLTAAMRVAAGEIVHRDFYANYGPAEFYLLSWLFKLFGQQVMVERVFDLSVRAAILTIAYLSLAYYTRKWVAVVVTVVCMLWLCSVGNHGYPIYPTLLLTIGSTLIMTQVLTCRTGIWLPFAAGILTGLAAIFRYDIGFLAFVAHVSSAVLIISWMHSDSAVRNSRAAEKILPYIAGAGLPVFLVLFWYWQVGALSSFFNDIVSYPSQYYGRMRGLPFPGISSLFVVTGTVAFAVYLPAIVCIAVVLGFLTKQATFFINFKGVTHTESLLSRRVVFIVCLTCLVAAFYLKGIVRVSVEHMQLALLPSIMLMGVLFEVTKCDARWFKYALRILAVLLVATASASVCKKLIYNKNLVLKDVSGFFSAGSASNPSIAQADSGDVAIDPRLCSWFFVEDYRAAAIRFMSRNTSPEQRIFVGLTRHDKIFVNDVSAYFLVNRMPATKWHHFDPGLQTGAEVQSEMVVDLEKTKPPYIWIESTWNGVNEPNESALGSGVKILDDYIMKKYQLIQGFGPILILRRNE